MTKQEELESRYTVLIYPSRIDFHQSCLDFYTTHGHLTPKQIERLKNPNFTIKVPKSEIHSVQEEDDWFEDLIW